MGAALQLGFVVLFPALALYGSRRVKPLRWLGPVGLCYLAGLIAANLPGVGAALNRSVSMHAAEVAVPLSIPLLLFATQASSWLKLARPTLLAFGSAIVATVASAALYGNVFRDTVAEAWKIAGMLVGVYVGGTPNMSVIGLALHVKEETFVVLNASDVVIGGAYLLFLLTIAQRVVWTFLPKFQSAGGAVEGDGWPETDDSAGRMAIATKLREGTIALAAALTICAAGAGVSWVLYQKLEAATVLVVVTTLAIVASFVRRLRENATGYELGEYLQLVFCVAIGSLASLRELAHTDGRLLAMVAAVQFTAIGLHFLLCALFRVDADTVLITSTATIFGPAFIGPVAKSLRNREVLAAGIAAALAGVAVANYLGLSMAYLLEP
ncbi:MAG: DUF819 family protein [Myxococcaceae bacterium]|nr:DUF819 family protein [Myxococcaceae bacterium]